MSNHAFTLKSGAKLQITTGGFEVAITLVEAIKQVTLGMPADLQLDNVILANPLIRKALYPLFATVLYETLRVGPELFDDPKWADQARGDYFELCSRVIEVNCKPFFLTISSASMASHPPATESPGQP